MGWPTIIPVLFPSRVSACTRPSKATVVLCATSSYRMKLTAISPGNPPSTRFGRWSRGLISGSRMRSRQPRIGRQDKRRKTGPNEVMTEMPNELMAPEIADEDPNSYELIRVWAAKGARHVSMNWSVWEKEPKTWGTVLAHLAG